MSDIPENSKQLEESGAKKVGKQIGMTLLAVVFVAAILGLMALFHVGAWMPFLTLCVWAIIGMKMGIKDLVYEFLGIFVGLGMGYLLQHGSELGDWALPLFFAGVVCLVISMVNHVKFLEPLFNNYTAVFLTVCTAMPYGTEIFADYLFSLVLFGVCPAIIGVVLAKKGGKAASGEDKETTAQA